MANSFIDFFNNLFSGINDISEDLNEQSDNDNMSYMHKSTPNKNAEKESNKQEKSGETSEIKREKESGENNFNPESLLNPREKIAYYIKESNNYLAVWDIKNALLSLDKAKNIAISASYINNIYTDNYDDEITEIEELRTKIESAKVIKKVRKGLKSGHYKEALSIISHALESDPHNVYYLDCYYKIIQVYKESKIDEKQAEIFKEQEDFAQKSKMHYQKAIQYKNNKKYQEAHKELEEAVFYARKADIQSNKFVILKNKILSESNPKSTSKTKNYTSNHENSKIKSKNVKNINRFEGYGTFDDEYDEHIPSGIAEIISKKTEGQSSNTDNNEYIENIADRKSEQNKSDNSHNASGKETNDNEKILQLLIDIENYLKINDVKNASTSLKMIKMLDKTNKFTDKIKSAEKKIGIKKVNPQIDNLLQTAKNNISLGNYTYANTLIKEAYDLALGDDGYINEIKEIENSISLCKIESQINKYIKLNQYKRAESIIISYLKKEPDNTALKNKLAELEKLKNITPLYEIEPQIKKYIHLNQYKRAIEVVEAAIKNEPDNKFLLNKLSELKLMNNRFIQCEEMYNEANEFFINKDYENAHDTISEVIEFAKNTKMNFKRYEKLEKNIIEEKNTTGLIKNAEITYQQVIKIYENDNPDYELIIDSLNNVLSEYSKFKSNKKDEMFVKCNSLLSKVQSEYNVIQAENLYNQALECYLSQDYKSALTHINEALKLIPDSQTYTDLKNKIINEYEIYKKFDNYYQNGFNAYNNAQFDDAAENINNALKLKPNDKSCTKLLEKINKGKIDIMTCSKQGLLKLDFIDNELAENIIQARNNGKIGYDYKKFVEQFNIMPHQWADVEEKILFPLKQANKYGRKIDI